MRGRRSSLLNSSIGGRRNARRRASSLRGGSVKSMLKKDVCRQFPLSDAKFRENDFAAPTSGEQKDPSGEGAPEGCIRSETTVRERGGFPARGAVRVIANIIDVSCRRTRLRYGQASFDR